MLSRFASTIVCIILAGAALTGCSASSSNGPVASEIKTYDTTFTGDAYGKYAATKSMSEAFNPALRSGPVAFNVKREAAGKKTHFIEFRARNALTYGHASVVFGKLDASGRIPVNAQGVLDPRMVQISGLHPAGTDPQQWAKGHVTPVPAETGPSDGDFEDKYVTARYQINLTEEEFRQVVSVIKRHKYSYATWYAPNYATNCLGYIGSIAKSIGLKVPVVPSLPKEYVRQLKSMNS